MTWLLVALALTWSGLVAWAYTDHPRERCERCERCDRTLPQPSHADHERPPR